MNRRNIITEILSKRDRIPPNSEGIDLFNERANRIEESAAKLVKLGEKESIYVTELTRYFPIALVSSIEGYFRFSMARLIDKGTPFIERVPDLRGVNINIDAVVAIQTRKISFGEYISHFVSLGNLDEINSAMSTLLNIDFLDRLLSSDFDVFKSLPHITLDSIRGDFVLLIKDLFKTRHILCHEFAPDLLIDNVQMAKFMTAASIFIVLSDVIIWAEENAGQAA